MIISELRKQLTLVFNRYIRLRDLWKGCISCGKLFTWGGDWQAGHYEPQGASCDALRFSEINVNGQCRECNYAPAGSKKKQEDRIRARHGKDALQRIQILKMQKQSFTATQFEELIEAYRKMVKVLEKQFHVKPMRAKKYAKKAVLGRAKPDWRSLYKKSKSFKPCVIDMEKI